MVRLSACLENSDPKNVTTFFTSCLLRIVSRRPGPGCWLQTFLDLCLKPTSDRLLTSTHYKETDTHSFLNYTSSHPANCKNSIPYSQFLRLRRICSEENDFENKSKEMASFIRSRGYPSTWKNLLNLAELIEE